MDVDLLQGVGLGAGGTMLVALSYAVARVYGSGKERMDFQQTSRAALEKQIEGLNIQLNKAWDDNADLRTSWVKTYTDAELARQKMQAEHEAEMKQLEEARQALQVRNAVLEADNRNLLARMQAVETETARLRNMVQTPNVYPEGYFDPPALPSPS